MTKVCKILCVLGTRPEAIKLAPVVHALRERAANGCAAISVCATGQHRELADDVLRLFAIEPDYNLEIMSQNQSPARVAQLVLDRLGPVFEAASPDWMIVQGDTTTVASASLAAFYSGIKVAHVEAGLRTHRKREPFPEEINRRVVTLIADIHFAPTQRAVDNLRAEGVPREDIRLTGNPGVDALIHIARRPLTATARNLFARVGIAEHNRDGTTASPRLLLVTAHRRENLGEPLERICVALKALAGRYRGSVKIVFPVHPNPSVGPLVNRILGDVENVVLAPPLDYASMVQLLSRSCLALTDSGGIQEEAPALGKPVLVLRNATERIDGVEAGVASLVGTDTRVIIEETARLLEDPNHYRSMTSTSNPYGDGNASARIVDALLMRHSGVDARR